MIGKTIEYKKEKFKIIDKVTMGNNPPTYYYILEGRNGKIFEMAVSRDTEKWHFKEITHWKLAGV